MLKKINFMMAAWLILFTMQCQGESTLLRYEIYFDSSMNNEIEVREEIFDVYQTIIHGVDKDLRASLVFKNLDLFQINDTYRVTAKGDTVVIVVGNGKGTTMQGEFDWVLCGNQVKPKSWLKEVLGF